MIIDSTLEFSNAQAITGTAASTNVIDFSGTKVGEGTPVPLYWSVQTTFDNLTSLTVSIEDSADNSSFATVQSGPAVLLADLVAGYRGNFSFLPNKLRRYVRLKYTVAGSNPSAGKIDAGVVYDAQTNQVY